MQFDQLKRREFVTLLGGAAATWPLTVHSQQASKIPRIGFLGAASPSTFASRLEGIRMGLRDFGYVEGRNITIDYRWAEGRYERLPELAAELVRSNVDIIVTHTTPGSLAAKQATTRIPIVVALIGDPVAAGVVASLARPGGNITGARRRSDRIIAIICCTCSGPVMAQSVESLRCEVSDAIGAKRTCRERRERVALTKMTTAVIGTDSLNGTLWNISPGFASISPRLCWRPGSPSPTSRFLRQ